MRADMEDTLDSCQSGLPLLQVSQYKLFVTRFFQTSRQILGHYSNPIYSVLLRC